MINIAPLTKTQKFIEKAKIIHGNRYDYSLVEYVHSRIKVNIICKEHGLFSQHIHTHLKGRGCFKCGDRRKTKEEFIKSSILIHGDLYNYNLVKYINANTKVHQFFVNI